MSLFNVTNVHEPQQTESIEYSVAEYLSEGLLACGAFLNYTSGTLLQSPRPGLTSRTVYQTPRAGWVWESGVGYNPQPVAPSGVYVDGVFKAFGSGCVPNYPAGSVTFSPALSGSPQVVASYAARTARVYTRRAAPWFYAIQTDSYDPAQVGSGVWSPDGRNRAQLPAVFVQALPQVGRFEGRELGSLGRVHRQDVFFSVVAETQADRDRLHDVLVGQWQTRFNGIDLKKLSQDGRQPLLGNGNINPSGVGAYTSMSAAYPWSQIRVGFVESTSDEAKTFGSSDASLPTDGPRLWTAVVRWQVEADLPH